jgi:hypothetical protein
MVASCCAFFAWAAWPSKARPRRKLQIDPEAFGKPTIRILPRQRCPYCHDGVSGQTHACAGCSAIYHVECLEESGGCSTLGCKHAARRRRRGA